MADAQLNSGFPDRSTRVSGVAWLIIIIASIGFLFDTYELLMTPLTAPPAIAELLRVPLNHPAVTVWTGRLLWISALCGGTFGLLGGWLTDKLGRKTVMAGAIFIYSFSPFAAAYSTSLPMFVVFRSTTFIGVCVEFVAAITWMAEVFDDPRQRARWLGITQAFASLGGVAVTLVSYWVDAHAATMPHIGLPASPVGAPSTWRYLLLTGLLPAIPIALMLPFVPESRIWKQRRASGTLKRPSFTALFAPELRRVTLVTAVLSACAYGIAFGALQLTPLRIAPGLPELAQQGKALGGYRAKAAVIAKQYDAAAPGTKARADAEAALKANLKLQSEPMKDVKRVGNDVQTFQETGGLIGRIALAALIIIGMSRLKVLRIFQIPSLIVLPLTYLYLFKSGGHAFFWMYGLCGFLTVAQFSYFGEYLPKVFPVHLRGTGGSFATNVGGRMIGTSMALVTTSVVAPWLAHGTENVKPFHVAQAAGYVALAMAVISLIVGLWLPEPKEETTIPTGRQSITPQEGAAATPAYPGGV